MKASHLQRGFTLLEMLLALSIFALMGLAGYQLLQSQLRARQSGERHNQNLSAMVRVMELLEQDLLHALIPLSAGKEPAFISGSGAVVLQLTRRNWLNPHNLPRAGLQRIAWHYADETLTRTSLSLDQQTAHFSGITALRLRYFSAGRWQESWQAGYALPEAIEITLTYASQGSLTRVFLPGGGR
ncbi:type II secretion system minor pseudopilin GspJ [Huaxiibacter chinensis]